MTPADAFLQAIAAAPDDDGPRLIWADWLEENGQSARADLIRVQCWLAGIAPAEVGKFGSIWERQYQEMRRRERELLQNNWPEWLPEGAERPCCCANLASPERYPDLPAYEFHRGIARRAEKKGRGST